MAHCWTAFRTARSRACRSSPRARLVAGEKRSFSSRISLNCASSGLPGDRSGIGVVIADV